MKKKKKKKKEDKLAGYRGPSSALPAPVRVCGFSFPFFFLSFFYFLCSVLDGRVCLASSLFLFFFFFLLLAVLSFHGLAYLLCLFSLTCRRQLQHGLMNGEHQSLIACFFLIVIFICQPRHLLQK